MNRVSSVAVLTVLSFSLIGCSGLTQKRAETQKFLGDLTQTASGVVKTVTTTAVDTVDATKKAAAEAKKTADDLQERAGKIQNGVQQIQEGLKGSSDQ